MKDILFDLIIPVYYNIEDGENIKYRVDNLNYVLTNVDPSVHIIVIEQISDKEYSLIDLLDNNVKNKDNVDLYKQFYTGMFNKPWLYNICAKHYTITNDLIFGEADCLWEDSSYNSFINFKKYIENEEISWCFAWNTVDYHCESDRVTRPNKGGMEGMWVYIEKNFFKSIGGYNEWFQLLGGMDNEIIRRCESVTKTYPIYKQKMVHKYHPKCTYKDKTDNRKFNRDLYNKVRKNARIVIKNLSNIFNDYCGEKETPACISLNNFDMFKK